MSTLCSRPEPRPSIVCSRLLPAACLAAAISILGACEEDIKAPQVTRDAGAAQTGDAASAPVTCEGKPEGEACGSDRHCIKEQCLHNTCGDGVQAGDEECDDGNQAVGDACNPSCKLIPVTCGDGKTDAGEECDDGNRINADACANSCTLNRCGNHRVDPNNEECDDGNREDDDYCSNSCRRDQCRNGRLDPGEDCDDGNAINDDGCSNACLAIACGDGVTYTVDGPLKEECDDGNKVDNDTCANACTKNECGNKRVDTGETCDGNTGPLGVCNAQCSGFEEDLCDKCSKAKCNTYLEHDFYGPCRVKAPDILDFGDPPVPPKGGFTENCTAYDQCILRTGCGDAKTNNGLIFCVCGTVPIAECLGGDTLTGPCASEAIKATECSDTPTNACVVGANFTDLIRPSGYANTLFACRLELCAAACSLH